MSADESGTLARFELLRSDHVEPALHRHEGRVVGEAGDSLLVEFALASDAVECAVEVQARLTELNAELPEERRMRFRMGVNLGEVIADGATIHRDRVDIAEPICAFRVAPERMTAPTGRPIRDDRVTIAVLPFTNMSGDPEQEYFSDGITEDLITAPAKSLRLSLAARNSSFLFKAGRRRFRTRDVNSARATSSIGC